LFILIVIKITLLLYYSFVVLNRAQFVSIKFTSHDTAWKAFQRLRYHFGDEELFRVSWQPSPRYLDSLRRARHFSNEHLQQSVRAFFTPKDAHKQSSLSKKRDKSAVGNPQITHLLSQGSPKGHTLSSNQGNQSEPVTESKSKKDMASMNKSVKQKSSKKESGDSAPTTTI